MAANRPSHDETRMKAEALRQAQQQRDKRVRNVIIVVVVVLLALVAIGVAAVIYYNKADSSPADPQPTTTESAAPSQAGSEISADELTFIVSADGVGTEKEGVPTIEEFYDYSCHACADVSNIIGPSLVKAVKEGKINVKLMPVDVVNMEWHPVATQAAAIVYRDSPEYFVEYHQELMTFFKGQFDTGNGKVVQDATASAEKVKEIASRIKVPDEVIAKFDPEGAKAALQSNTDMWMNLTVEGREGLGTPEFISNGKKLKITGENVGEYVGGLIRQARDAQS